MPSSSCKPPDSNHALKRQVVRANPVPALGGAETPIGAVTGWPNCDVYVSTQTQSLTGAIVRLYAVAADVRTLEASYALAATDLGPSARGCGWSASMDTLT